MAKTVVIYLSPYDLLRPRTNQVSDVRFCEGFAQNGCDVHLIVPYSFREDNIPQNEVKQYYGLETSFDIRFLPTQFKGDVKGAGKLVLTAWYGQQAVREIMQDISSNARVIIISRHGGLLVPYLTLKKTGGRKWSQVKVIHWLHDLKLGPKDRFIYKNCDALLATNRSIIQDLYKSCKLKNKPSDYTLNPITQAQAEEKYTKSEARKLTGLEHISTPLVVYTGKLGLLYNLELQLIIEAAGKLPSHTFLFTGGKDDTVAHWKKYCSDKGISNVIFTGYIADYTKIKYYQYAADVLVSYYTRQGHDPRYNLPNKLCEYMLTGNPIVSPDYPASRDLLNVNNCYFTAAENSSALAETIQQITLNVEEAIAKGATARRDVEEITFRKVTARLISFFQKIG